MHSGARHRARTVESEFMAQTLTTDGLRLLEQLQQAVETAKHAVLAREAQVEATTAVPAGSEVEVHSPSLTSLEHVCRLADGLAAKAESELADVEAALRQWLAASELCARRLEQLAQQYRPAA